MSDKERLELLLELVRGLRGLAEVESEFGSKTWKEAIRQIDKAVQLIKRP